MTEYKRRSRAKLFIAFFLIAFFGFAAASVGFSEERGIETTQPSGAPFSEKDALDRLSASMSFRAGALATLIISFLLLVIAGGAKMSGRSLLPQAPRNIVTWNIRAVFKSIVIVLLLYLLAFWIIYLIGKRSPEIIGRRAFGIATDSILKLLICFCIYIMLRGNYGANNSSMGIRLRGIGRALLYSFLGYLSIVCVVYAGRAAGSLLGNYLGLEEKVSPVVTLLLTEPSQSVILTALIAIVVVTPLTEEFFFRMLTFSALRRSFGFWPSACLSSLFFALIHPDFYSLIPIFLLGAFLAYIYEKTQNFASVVFVHALHNGIQVFLILSARRV